ncbi:putative MFS transporter [Penicillium brasilianum]|uniref:Putative MFS transporter n=1 Tax=Penicillium brasilianum TaxID=104259 RepID=A0A1S9RCI3_PENBI|nr:putative MFS transporter [Penicillium brasilianum]
MATTQTVTVKHTGSETIGDRRVSMIRLETTSVQSSESERHGNDQHATQISKLRSTIIVFQMSGNTMLSSIINGLVTVGLPTITKDLHLPSSLSFWPVSVSGLATASTLLLAGSLADVVGPRWVDLVGTFASGASMLGMGFVKEGTQLVAMRAIQGVGLALHLASAVGIVTQVFPQGKSRNMAFACLGMSQPFGFCLGLVLGGVFVDTVGWRVGWYIAGGAALFLSFVGLWALPGSQHPRKMENILHDLKYKVDWVGALLASAFMALLCYLLAILSSNVYRIKETASIVILCLAALALPSFIIWIHYQVRRGRPALIPNAFWRNATFSSICATIALSFAVINSMELFASLFFQEIQQLSALQASIRILPSLVVGVLVQVTAGFFVDRVPAVGIVVLTAVLSSLSPLLMATAQPSWPYWANTFVAQLLQPVNCNALFTVGLIIITDIFPEDTKALAGAVFNTAAQFGTALGFAILQVISSVVTEKKEVSEDEIPALLAGYRASFWTMFAFMILCIAISGLGLRKTGRIGLKRD